MKNTIVKEVLEEIVKIDAEAERLRQQNMTFAETKDTQFKEQIHSHELELMKGVRLQVKHDLEEKSEALIQQKIDLKTAIEQEKELVLKYFYRYKEELIEQLFHEIFIEADHGKL